MLSNEESQNPSTIFEIKNQESEFQNTNQDSITVNTTESKEVNEKIIELEKERHANDISEGKDKNAISIRNVSFKDRLKRKSKLEDINDKIEEKENEQLTTVNNLILNNPEEKKEIIINNYKNEIKEEIVEENKSDKNNEIKEEKIESKLEIKSINNKTPSKNNSKSSSLSKKNINWKSLYILLNQIYLVINDEPAKHYGLLL